LTSFDPMSLVPPITTSFMILLLSTEAFPSCRSHSRDRTAHGFMTMLIRCFSMMC